MSQLIIFNKPFHVLSQFGHLDGKSSLADYIDIKNVYPAGRLDYDSEGLLLLTDDGQLQHKISDPKHKMEKCYWVQVEGNVDKEGLKPLMNGIELKDGRALPAKVKIIPAPEIWPRTPPIRYRKNVTDTWLEIKICEGKNRQVRRMTAAIGHPTLRLIRYSIGPWSIKNLSNGAFLSETISLPKNKYSQRKPQKK